MTLSVRPLRASVASILADLLHRDRPHFVLRQRREDHDFIDAVANSGENRRSSSRVISP